jgi:SagB-type dehydrogenase family enzyme
MTGTLSKPLCVLSLLLVAAGLAVCGQSGATVTPSRATATPAGATATLAGGSPSATALPAPALASGTSLEEALVRRRSVREFENTPLTPSELGQLLWAAQGITHDRGFRTAPSAGALYPLELYVVTAEGVFHYEPQGHRLRTVSHGDARPALCQAALSQVPVRQAPAVFVVTAVRERTAVKYGAERSPRYVHLEAGHAAQNLLLQAVVLGLGAVPIGAFYDEDVQAALGVPADHEPLYLIPVGHARGASP